jgi:RecB family exonuclease
VPLEELDPDTYDLSPDEGSSISRKADPFSTYRGSRFATAQARFVEVPFDLLLEDQARVRGRIDAIYEPEPGVWEVVDFKSGRPSSNPSVRVQLEAYALAVHQVSFASVRPDHLRVTFAYLGDGLTEVSEPVDSSWLAGAEEHLAGLIGSIRQERWEPSPSPTCTRCDFRQFCPAGREWVAAHDLPT